MFNTWQLIIGAAFHEAVTRKVTLTQRVEMWMTLSCGARSFFPPPILVQQHLINHLHCGHRAAFWALKTLFTYYLVCENCCIHNLWCNLSDFKGYCMTSTSSFWAPLVNTTGVFTLKTVFIEAVFILFEPLILHFSDSGMKLIIPAIHLNCHWSQWVSLWLCTL